jgi:predicted acetyltransferase
MPGKRRDRSPIERVSGLETGDDMRQAIDASASAFREKSRSKAEFVARKVMWSGSTFDPEHTRIVVADGRVVSQVIMAPRMMRFGPVGIPAMTVGGVATHPDYQRLGYNAVCMNDCTRYMKEHGYLLAYMQGFRKYYHRFGYYPYSASGGVTVFAGESQRQGLPGRLRAMTGRDIPRVARLYEKATKGYVCTAVRDRAVWEWLMRCGKHTSFFENPKVILDQRGRLCGYLTMGGGDDLIIRELVVLQDERSWRVALWNMGWLARRYGLKKYGLPLTWGEPMTVFLRQEFETWTSLNTKPDGGRLLMVVDFPALMTALEPFLTERWRAASPAVRNARWTLKSEIGSVGITASAGRIRVGGRRSGPRVRIGMRWLSGLLTGYHGVRDIAARKDVQIPSSMMSVLNALFPPGWPVTLRGDNY